MLERIKTFLVVTLFTILIWLAADQNVSQQEEFDVYLRVSMQDRYAAIVAEREPSLFHVKLKGTRRRLNQVRPLLDPDDSAAPPVFDVPLDGNRTSSSAPQKISSAELFLRIKGLPRALSIEDIKPETADVLIDIYETVEGVRIEPEYGTMQVNDSVSPATVSVQMPRFAAERLRTSRVIHLDLEQRLRQRMRETGQNEGTFRFTEPIRFEVPKIASGAIRITPPEVAITASIQVQTETRRIGPVQITWAMPDEVQARFTVQVRAGEMRPFLDVTGSRDTLDALKPADIRGYVEVKAEYMDRAGEEFSATPQFVLPTGLSISSRYISQPIVYKLIARSSAAPPAG